MGIFIVPPVIFLIAVGPPSVLILMVLLATFLGLREFFSLALPTSKWIERCVGIGLGLAVSIVITQGNIKTVFPFFVLLIIVLSILFMATSQNLSSTISNMGTMFFGIFYVGFLLSYVSLIRNMVDGKQWSPFHFNGLGWGYLCLSRRFSLRKT